MAAILSLIGQSTWKLFRCEDRDRGTDTQADREKPELIDGLTGGGGQTGHQANTFLPHEMKWGSVGLGLNGRIMGFNMFLDTLALIAFNVISDDGTNSQIIDSLVQDCSNSSALAMELQQSYTKPSIYLSDYVILNVVRPEKIIDILKPSQIAKFMVPTWGPPGSCRPQMTPCWPHEPCYLRLPELVMTKFYDVIHRDQATMR